MSKPLIIYGSLTLIGVTVLVLILKQKNALNKWLNPVNGKITSGFGLRTDPVTGKQNQGHNGIDVAVPVGTPVKAPLDGTVVSTASSTDGGNQLILVHDNPGPYQYWKTGYAHLQKVMVSNGQKIKKGQTVALSGNTGKSTGPHLHLTLTDANNQKVNPANYFYKA